MAAGCVLPMFPLESPVLPGTMIPLHIFEPRYRALVRAVISQEPPEFGIVGIERGREVGGNDQRFNVGVVATVLGANELGDGRWSVLGEAGRRIGIVDWLPDNPYPIALVVERDEQVGVESSAAVARLATAFNRLVDAAGARRPERVAPAPAAANHDLVRRVWEMAALSGLSSYDTQLLLADDDLAVRADRAAALITERTELISALGVRPEGEGDR